MSGGHFLGDSHRVPACRCLSCGRQLDGTTPVDANDGPSAGDLTICIYCGHLMAFDEGLALREPSDAELVEMAGDERILTIQMARGQMKGNA